MTRLFNQVSRLATLRHSDVRTISVAIFTVTLLSGCAAVPLFTKHLPGDRAFIKQFPAEPNGNRLRLAIKDNIDMKGVVTTAGSNFFQTTHAPAKADAPCLAGARRRNVVIVGKTNMTEFAVAPSGLNEFFGTPQNPLRHTRIPGGS